MTSREVLAALPIHISHLNDWEKRGLIVPERVPRYGRGRRTERRYSETQALELQFMAIITRRRGMAGAKRRALLWYRAHSPERLSGKLAIITANADPLILLNEATLKFMENFQHAAWLVRLP